MKAEILLILAALGGGIWYLFFPQRAVALWKLFGPMGRFDPVGRLMWSKHGVTTCRVLGLILITMGLIFLALVAPRLWP